GGPRGAARHGAGRPADPHARARRDGPGALSSPPARARLAVLAAVAASALAFALYARMTWPWVALGWVGLVPWLAVLDRAAWVRQAADLAGAAGLTFLLVVANECALAGLRGLVAGPGLRRALAPAACVVTLVLGLLGYGALRCHELASDADRGGALTAGIVQADIGQYDRLRAHLGSFEAVRTILDPHFAPATALLGRPGLDLLACPGTVYPTTF